MLKGKLPVWLRQRDEVLAYCSTPISDGGTGAASTPAYPHHAAFQDPTHVNIITSDTHHYFTRPTLTAQMYGYVGDFEVRRVMRVKPMHDYQPELTSLVQRLRQRSRERRGACSHLVWEFEARK